jgi:hypothetical protein
LNYEQYKEQFLKGKLMFLEKLNKKETDSVPKSTKSFEYAFLSKKGNMGKNGVYYWKKPKNKSDDEISPYTEIETVQLLSKVALEIDNIKDSQASILKEIVGLFILLVVITAILLFILLS